MSTAARPKYARYAQRATYTLLGDLVVLANSNQPLTPEGINTLDSAPRPTRLTTLPAGHRRELPSGFEQAVPGSMVFFILLVLLSSGGASLVAEREQGILRRLASSPMSRGAVVLGKWGARMMLGMVQIAFCMLTGSILFHVRWGDYLGAVLIVLLCYAAFATSSGMLLASVSHTRGQAAAFGSLVANLLACIGGCWWPAEIMPRFLQAISRSTPPGMAMDALHQLVNFGSGPAAALPQAITLGALALIIGFLAARNFRFL
jgi:ABC-2 type transport system permease protein